MPPIIAGLINIVPGLVNTILSLVKNKKNVNEATSALLPAFTKNDPNNIADGLELSSTTVAGYGLGGLIIYYAMAHEPVNLHILAIGAAVAIATSITKVLKQ